MSETVLVVDDNEANRMVVEGNLVAAGYTVITVDSGQAAIDKFKERQSDLVLLDIVMPGMDGFDTCRALRALPNGTDVPIVFLTALNDLESHKQALDAGADDLMTKPINRNELMLRVRSMLWMRRLRSELRSGYNLISSQRDALLHAQQQKEELSSFIVHDLKSPLNTVVGYAAMLTTAPQVAADAQCSMMAGQILDAAGLIERMIMNLLDIKSSEDGKLSAKIGGVDFKEMLANVCKFVELRFKNKGVTLDVSAAADVKIIRADPDLLRRTLDNLLANALRFTPKGRRVQVRARVLDKKAVEIKVIDEGPGIPKQFREKIFEKYVQLDKNLADHNQGLGLTFCRIAMEAHGGKVWAEESEAGGACFTLSLPHQA